MSLPVAAIENPALVKDYAAEGKLVYINDLAFTANGHPVILYITSISYEAGPKVVHRNGLQQLTLVRNGRSEK